MARIATIDKKEDLAPEHRSVYETIAESRGAVGGPFVALLHSPEVASRTAHLGRYLRFEGILDKKVVELATLAAARESSANTNGPRILFTRKMPACRSKRSAPSIKEKAWSIFPRKMLKSSATSRSSCVRAAPAKRRFRRFTVVWANAASWSSRRRSATTRCSLAR